MWRLLPAILFFTVGNTSAKIIDTLYGKVDGNTVSLDDGTVVNSWWGIPFARPPTGELRFEQPQVPVPWADVFQAKNPPDACMQDPLGVLFITHPGWRNFSEDCLSLNVFAPEDLTEGPLAVMVWFHGGGYTGGANIQFPGHFLAAKGVVVVVPNYRLNSFGFLSTPDGTIKGNMGMFDQALALRWVRNNIANFGGNPNRVTIFGQSAGAASSSLHMVSPYSQGLFHQAILESGTDTNLWSLNYPGSQPDTYVYQLAKRVNCERDTDPEIVDCLRSRSATVIRLGQDIECTPGYFCQGFEPIVDGPGGFLPKLPLELKQELDASSFIPIISGITRDDGSLYTQILVPESNNGGFNSTEFEYYLKTRLLNIFAGQMTSEQYEQVYDALRWYYVNWPYLEDLDANRDAMNTIITDGAYGYDWDQQLKANSVKNSNTYAYVYSFLSSNSTSFIPAWMGAPHMAELPYVWGYGKLLTNQAVRDDSAMHYDVVGWTPEDAVYADYQITLWTNFAKYGNPTPQPVKAPFSDELTTWEKFSIDDDLKVFDFDKEITTHKNFRQQRNAFYYDYIASIVGRPILAGTGEKPSTPAGDFRFNSRLVKDAVRRFVADALAARGINVSELMRDD